MEEDKEYKEVENMIVRHAILTLSHRVSDDEESKIANLHFRFVENHS